MNILFLDIDGVLNSHRTMMVWAGGLLPPVKDTERWTQESLALDPVAVAMLKLVTETIDHCAIVISSTWRLGEELETFHRVFDLYGWDTREVIIGMTPVLHKKRGYEIKAWMDTYMGDIMNYAIIDDDSDMLKDQMERFVKTNHTVGLSYENVDRLLTLFNKDHGDLMRTRNAS